jgi:pyrimidine-nucleoside phosphorylase
MNPIPVIEAARDGTGPNPDELEAFLRGYLEGRVEEYQMSAFLMAIVLRGMGREQLSRMVEVMLHSGRVLDLSHLPGPRVDKHSTGGVGDKVSLALAPLAAGLGLFVPMMSGRGLGHTGGTLDKLEAIPGFRTQLDLAEFEAILTSEGFAMIGQTEEIAPLDRRLYDLRSVTATVPSIPLIAASIMSKKLAEGLGGLVLDVKAGSGAFLPAEEETLALARTMVAIGDDHGVSTVALVTAMDRPLGRSVGNALEVEEALACLRGEGPADLREIVLSLATEMQLVGGTMQERDRARERAVEELDGGGPLERFRRVVERQGGDPKSLDDPGRLPATPVRLAVEADREGTVLEVEPAPLGRAVVELGGGRTRLGQEIDPAVGFSGLAQPGDVLASGDRLGVVHARSGDAAILAAEVLRSAVRVGEEEAGEVRSRPLVSHRITAADLETSVPG